MGDIIQDTSDPAGDYSLGPSSYLAAILLVGHMSAAALLWWLDFSPFWKIVAWSLLLASLVHEERMAWRIGGNTVLALRIARDGALHLHIRKDGWREGELLGSSYVSSFLTVINVRLPGERRMRSVVLLSDSIQGDDYRRLRVWLRWRPRVEPGSSG